LANYFIFSGESRALIVGVMLFALGVFTKSSPILPIPKYDELVGNLLLLSVGTTLFIGSIISNEYLTMHYGNNVSIALPIIGFVLIVAGLIWASVHLNKVSGEEDLK
jgi:uncharacterized membrane protein YoaT (DUF817 family)